jgi:hypothetical protein
MPGAAESATGNNPSVSATGGTATGATTGTSSGGIPIGTSPTRADPAGTSPAAGSPAASSRAAVSTGAPGSPVASTDAEVDHVADMVLARIKDKLDDDRDTPPEIPSAEHAIALREQAPELYDLWLKIAQEKAATENYVDRAPYEIPERLAQSGRPRALGALIIVLSFCGYLAWLGGPGPYIGGLIAILDLGAMFGMFFGLRPEGLAENKRADRKRLLPATA